MSRVRRNLLDPLSWEYRLQDNSFSQAKAADGSFRESHSHKYQAGSFEYKYITLTKKQYDIFREELRRDPKGLVSEKYLLQVLRVQQTPGWEHYYIYPMNPHVLCLRRLRAASQQNNREEYCLPNAIAG